MTTSIVNLTEGSGSKKVATYSVTEDAAIKELQRITSCDSAGNEIEAVVVGQDTMAASLPVAIASDQSAVPISGTITAVTTITNPVTVSTHAVTIASGGVASGAVASGAVASGAVASGAFASGSIADGAMVTIGAKADAKSTATDTTSISIMSVLKQISASIQTFVFGAGTAAAAQRTTLASDDPAVATLGATTGSKVVTDANGTIQQYLRGLVTQAVNFAAGEYETVAASATDQSLGATGGTGDYLEAVLIVPGTSAAGAVSIKDGSGSSISIFAGGGTTALADLAPIYVPLGMISTSGAWKVTTGSNVTAIGIGNFT